LAFATNRAKSTCTSVQSDLELQVCQFLQFDIEIPFDLKWDVPNSKQGKSIPKVHQVKG
jgi:hypothetical protein